MSGGRPGPGPRATTVTAAGGGGLGEGCVNDVGADGARGRAESAGAVAEGAVGVGNLDTGAAGAQRLRGCLGAVGSGDAGGSGLGGELRGPGVVSAGKVGGGGRGRKRRREAVGEGSRRVDAGEKPAARKTTARGSRGGAGVSPRDLLRQRGAGGAGQNRGGAELVGVGGHVDAAAGGRHGVHGSGAKGAGGRGGAVRAGVG